MVANKKVATYVWLASLPARNYFIYLVPILQTSVAVGDIQDVRQNALLRQRELHVRMFFQSLSVYVFIFILIELPD